MRRPLWRSGGTVIAAAVAALVSVVPAGADPPPAPTPSEPPVESTTAPTPASTTAPPPTTVAPGASTTTTSSTTTTVPGTTLPPVDTDALDADSSGFSSLPAPLIPSASDDPLFHAALTVDDDLVKLAKAKVAYVKQIAATRKVAARAARVRSRYDEVNSKDAAARRHLENTRSILQAAALHAYAGYGSVESATDTAATDGATVLPYRTYVRVTISDATRHVTEARDTRGRTKAVADAARAEDRAARARLAASRADERAAKKAVADAKKKLDDDRAALRDLIASMPGLAPGTLDRLPDDVELPEGATPVESPAGTIVVPAGADPRTATALQFIVAQIGKPYLWGGTGPNAYDCSGLMLRGFQAAGVRSMPRVSQGQQVWATPVDAKDAQPGDLVFFGTPAYHVGVYIGGGLMIDAPFTGARVRVDRVWSSVSGYGRARW